MTAAQRAERDRRLSDGMANLVQNPNFSAFIDIVREDRERLIEDLCSQEVLKSDRLTLVAIGELRKYQSFLSIYTQSRDIPPPPATEGE